jgi:hypothetical protein
MHRRDALRYTAFVFGASMSASTVSAILTGCQVDDSDGWAPSFFTEDEARFIAELAETMLPKTDTPGAKEALVDRYLDTVRPLRFSHEDNLNFKSDLAAFRELAVQALGMDFTKASAGARLSWLTTTDKSAYGIVKDNPDMPTDERPFYLSLKEQILAGYFSSEIVAMEYFAFDPIPGSWESCIPYEQIGKAWAI